MDAPADVVATRAAYDTVAEDYGALVRDAFGEAHPERLALAELADHIGDEVRHHRHLYGHDLVLDSYRRSAAVVADAATAVGFTEVARTVRTPEPPEDCEQAVLPLRR